MRDFRNYAEVGYTPGAKLRNGMNALN